MSSDIDKFHCPGLYCGRTLLEDGNWSSCGACQRSFKRNSTSHCVSCEDSPDFYDWLYLGFMVLTVLVLHWYCIDRATKTKSFSRQVIILHLSALVEVIAAGSLTLLFLEPVGSFDFRSCKSKKLSDWYTVLHNPSPNYVDTIHCSQEAVYPLYTMVLVFFAMATIFMLLLRPWLAQHFVPNDGKNSIYAALYFYPILALFHTVFSGVIYFTFPFILIIASVVSNATYFALKVDQSMKFLVVSTVCDTRNIIILLGHWLLHAYGIIAVTQTEELSFHPYLLAIVPVPTAFYILTARFTDPNKLHMD